MFSLHQSAAITAEAQKTASERECCECWNGSFRGKPPVFEAVDAVRWRLKGTFYICFNRRNKKTPGSRWVITGPDCSSVFPAGVFPPGYYQCAGRMPLTHTHTKNVRKQSTDATHQVWVFEAPEVESRIGGFLLCRSTQFSKEDNWLCSTISPSRWYTGQLWQPRTSSPAAPPPPSSPKSPWPKSASPKHRRELKSGHLQIFTFYTG